MITESEKVVTRTAARMLLREAKRYGFVGVFVLILRPNGEGVTELDAHYEGEWPPIGDNPIEAIVKLLTESQIYELTRER